MKPSISDFSPNHRSLNMNTPLIETDRLILRRFTEDDLEAIYAIYSDEEVNTFLPWFPLKTMEEARLLYEQQYARQYRLTGGCRWAVCLKPVRIPIGYIHVSADDSHDLGYGLRKEYWRRGIITEAGEAVIRQLRQDGLPYITATHDVRNPRSGAVMKRLGMKYQYSYEEQWQPKNIPVTFRMYQLNLDGKENRVYRRYWDISSVHFIEEHV